MLNYFILVLQISTNEPKKSAMQTHARMLTRNYGCVAVGYVCSKLLYLNSISYYSIKEKNLISNISEKITLCPTRTWNLSFILGSIRTEIEPMIFTKLFKVV